MEAPLFDILGRARAGKKLYSAAKLGLVKDIKVIVIPVSALSMAS